jgi:putative tricarboxylic transport membrane protein
LLFFTPILADLSLLLGPAEIFWVTVTGLSLVAGLSGKRIIKGLVGVALGVALTMVGQDSITGDMRFTFDNYKLVGGIPFVPAMLGLFAVANILNLLENPGQSIAPLTMRKGAMRFVLQKLSKMKLLMLWSSVLGTLVGIIPGAGASISAFVAYGEAKRISKHPEEFGKGSYEGIAAPEAANNAVVGGAMVPLLALGIPGSGSAAVMFGALTVHGILPGPRLFIERADVVYTFMVGLLFTVVAMQIFGMVTIRWSSLTVQAPARFMVPGVLALSVIGTYGLANSLFDVYVLIGLGIIGYLLSKLNIPVVAIALGLVLGKLMEQSFQQAVLVGTVDKGAAWIYFLTRPVAVCLMLVAFAVLVSGIRQIIRSEPDSSEPQVSGKARARLTMRTANILLSLGLIALVIFGVVESRDFSERAAQLPYLLFGTFILLASIILIANITPKFGAVRLGEYPFADVPWRLCLGASVALVLFGLGADSLGFYETGFLFLVVVTWMMSTGQEHIRRPILSAVLFALGFDVLLYVAFKLVLQIPTPPGLLL